MLKLFSFLQSGNLPRALDLAFRTRQFGALQHISDDLDQKADPELLQRCANFFTDNGQYDKAVDLLATARKVNIGFQGELFYAQPFVTIIHCVRNRQIKIAICL